jgi:hypothetical protein
LNGVFIDFILIVLLVVGGHSKYVWWVSIWQVVPCLHPLGQESCSPIMLLMEAALLIVVCWALFDLSLSLICHSLVCWFIVSQCLGQPDLSLMGGRYHGLSVSIPLFHTMMVTIV